MASYYVWSGAAGAANGTSWANAYTTLTLAYSGKVAGDVFYVAHDHAESTTATIALTSSGTPASQAKVVCVNRAGSVPPVAADRLATAQVTTTTGGAINFAGVTHYDGIIFTCGTSGNPTVSLGALTATVSLRFDNCSLRCGSTGALSAINVGTLVDFNNTTVSFANVAQGINLPGAKLRWRNTASALLGTIPTALLRSGSGRGGGAECIGVDFSAAGSGKTIVTATGNQDNVTYRFVDCKLNAAVTKAVVQAFPAVGDIDFIRSGSSGVNYTISSYRFSGLLIEETTIVRTGGASDGTTPLAWKIVTTADCSYSVPFECPPIAIWNDTTGSSVTATVEGIWGDGAVPNDNDVWVDVEYLGDASSPQGSFVNDGTPDLLTAAAAQTSSLATWGGSTTKFKLNVSFTPQQKGWIYARVKCAKASSTFYIDPLVTLS